MGTRQVDARDKVEEVVEVLQRMRHSEQCRGARLLRQGLEPSRLLQFDFRMFQASMGSTLGRVLVHCEGKRRRRASGRWFRLAGAGGQKMCKYVH